jgi:hypothetical protein
MNLEITLNDGSKLYPSFDPEHKETILTFYRNQWLSKQIQAYIIRDNQKRILAVAV